MRNTTSSAYAARNEKIRQAQLKRWADPKEKEKMRAQNKARFAELKALGFKNSWRPVLVNGVSYPSMADACRELNLTAYKLKVLIGDVSIRPKIAVLLVKIQETLERAVQQNTKKKSDFVLNKLLADLARYK